MQPHDIRSPVIPVVPLATKRANHQAEIVSRAQSSGEVDMQPRVNELETHLETLRGELKKIRSDIRSIRHRLAYSAIGTAVVLGLLGWIANSRFDQVVSLLLAH
ncbi:MULTISPECIES: hypothetical protein [Pseudomonas]|jgi:hypothetical protein|uniref:hypothetical protein n=1 Tax=Pseudomonas TaxID=286 RepID=UPI00062B05A1|nr:MULTISPECIES: hypothetical protein [Pseudomonas]KKX67269.1 hypothetical protein PU99_05925 [Pseudomonas putida]MCK8654519.1 hypothetical protein [Pseudomonas umsongensis]NBB58530.1 hypothetical protein [Pseudomonas sp. ODNR1LW]OMQ32900.1 hypothetical protein BKX96_22505 [Pseudomonas putida]